MDTDAHIAEAKRLFNRVWELLELAARTPEQDLEMVHAAHASRHLWSSVDEPVRWARGEWQVSRVYATLGRAEPALVHAKACLEMAERHDLSAFDLGFGHEALARAHAVASHRGTARRHVVKGRRAADRVIDPQHRALLEGDLAGIDV